MNFSFHKFNNIIGWIVFAIALVTYTLTIEPSVSLWDCGEYIATSYRLEIGHPPGAPVFLLIANFFSNFASSPEQVPYWINFMSGLCSAFTILFLFWTLTFFAQKLAIKTKETLTNSHYWAILLSGAVGALCYTFSDSFWFSAVEGEVYAMSSLFTAIIVWGMTKWERGYGEARNDKWIVFSGLMIGLSIGVHLLNLLAVPALVFLYAHKKKDEFSLGRIVKFGVISVGILALIFIILIPGLVTVAGWMELFVVNSIGLPFNSGILLFFIALFALFVFLVRYTLKKSFHLGYISTLSFAFMILGFSLYVLLAIRSNANPPIDQNNPEDAVSMRSYLQREQYGSVPLLYGHQFASEVVGYEAGTPVYEKDLEKGEYVVKTENKQAARKYKATDLRLFPRMHSNVSSQHIRGYQRWGGAKPDVMPTMGQNLSYFWNYQVVYMYWRYFMWNFAGRQNDMQGLGGLAEGNWISGISFVDEARLGPQDNLPSNLRENKARNAYYFLPFLFGLFGLYFQIKHDKQNALVNGMLFFFTGLAIVLYVNQHFPQPRERDYSYVGSFYAFAIWVGLGAYALWFYVKKVWSGTGAIVTVSILSLLSVPVLMAKENWDDHDRSGRYMALAAGKNYLDSCEKNALLFTMGDNDTFPLWYLQEVEGYRTDVRILNLSLLNTDWYIDQLKREAYEGAPIPGDIEYPQYKRGVRDFALFVDVLKGAERNINEVNDFILSDRKETKVPLQNGEKIDFFPTKNMRIPVNKENAIASGVVAPEDRDLIVDYIPWTFKSDQMQKREIVVMDILSHFDWKRPMHFAITLSNDSRDFSYLDDYFELVGMTYKFVPIKRSSKSGSRGYVDPDHLLESYRAMHWAESDNPKHFVDESTKKMYINYRSIGARLMRALVDQGRNAEAKEVLEITDRYTHSDQLVYNIYSIQMLESLVRMGDMETAKQYGGKLLASFQEEVDYFDRFKGAKAKKLGNAKRISGQYLRMTKQVLSAIPQG